MTDTIQSPSIQAANAVPLVKHLSIVSELEAEIVSVKADAEALWTKYEVYVVAVVSVIAGFILKWIL